MNENMQKNELFENLRVLLDYTTDTKPNTVTLLLLMSQINIMGLINALPEAYKYGKESGDPAKQPLNMANMSEALPKLLPLLGSLSQNKTTESRKDHKRR